MGRPDRSGIELPDCVVRSNKRATPHQWARRLVMAQLQDVPPTQAGALTPALALPSHTVGVAGASSHTLASDLRASLSAAKMATAGLHTAPSMAAL